MFRKAGEYWGLAVVSGQFLNTWNLPLTVILSLTLTLSVDHRRSYQWMVRIRRNACCDFSPWADASGAYRPVAPTTIARPAAAQRPTLFIIAVLLMF